MANEGARRLYGRRRGPGLKRRQLELLETNLPALSVSADDARLKTPLDLFSPPARAVWLEIGFGAGEHLLWQARHAPDVGFIGCEPFLNGIAKVVAAVHDEALGNIRLHHGDARDVMAALGDGTLERIFLLFPDPWPKTRHHKRRFVTQETLGEFHRLLVPGGQWRFASDIPHYVRWTLREVFRHGGFEWTARRPADWRTRPHDWPPTRYETKALAAGRVASYLTFVKPA